MVPNPVPRLYQGVIDEVIGNLRDAFADEGIDEAVLGDLKNLWKKKLEDSRALEGPVQDHQPLMYVYMPKGEAEQAQYRNEHPANRVVYRPMPSRPVHNQMGPPRVMPMPLHNPVHLQHQQMGMNAPGPPG